MVMGVRGLEGWGGGVGPPQSRAQCSVQDHGKVVSSLFKSLKQQQTSGEESGAAAANHRVPAAAAAADGGEGGTSVPSVSVSPPPTFCKTSDLFFLLHFWSSVVDSQREKKTKSDTESAPCACNKTTKSSCNHVCFSLLGLKTVFTQDV